MPYVALEWDHKIAKPNLKWIVVQCREVGRKFGGPQALPPRHDVAYFFSEQTAERDAKAFAAYKTALAEGRTDVLGASEPFSNHHAAFAWDHNIFSPNVKWAVLEWNGDEPDGESVRNDVAYFTDPETAEADARSFRVLRDRMVEAEVLVAV